MHAKTHSLRLVCSHTAFALLAFLGVAAGPALANSYTQVNLVSDGAVAAATIDPNLKNPWGMSFSSTSPFWVSDQVTGVATIYTGTGVKIPLIVAIPGTGAVPRGLPTGQVFNSAGSGNFVLSNGSAASFMFATLEGTIDGWNGGAGNTALPAVQTPGAVYTGLALANNGAGNFLYAANFTSSGGINVFNSSFAATTLSGNFTDPSLPAGLAPYNIQNIGGNLYVEYAQIGLNGLPVPGFGIVDEFDANGNFVKRIATGGPLNVPWGITLAPANFGAFSSDLLIGNFGNGEIDAFNPVTDAFLGTLDDVSGNPIVNSGLWALDFGNGANGANPDGLYFTAGINGEKDGLFGEIVATPTPEPGTLALLCLGLMGLAAFQRRKKLA